MTPFEIDTGTTAWLLASAALVLLMTPGLAFFYGGMVRAKSVLNMMMMSFGALGLDRCHLDSLGLLDSLRRRHRLRPARRSASVPRSQGPHGSHHRGLLRRPDRYLPGDGLRRIPGRVRDHHRRPDLWCYRRSREVRRLDGLHRDLGHPGLLPGRPLGVRLLLRRAHSVAGSPTT